MSFPAQHTARELPDQEPRILIVRVGAMGDVIHALPAVAALRQAMPNAHIGWAIGPNLAPLLGTGGGVRDPERMPLVDVLHPVESKLWSKAPLSRATARSVLALRRTLREARYDVAIDLQGTLRSAAIARIGSGTTTFGPAQPWERPARFLYTNRVQQRTTHVIDMALEVVRAAAEHLGAKLPDTPPHPVPLPHDSAAEAWWAAQQPILCGDRPPILLAATAGWGAKEWPRAKFAALAVSLAERGYAVLLNTHADAVDPVTQEVLDRAHARSAEAATHVQPLQGTLPQLIAATRTLRAAIAGDSGPIHLAEALGVPTLALFGPTDPARTGPRHHSLSLRDPASQTDHGRKPDTEPGLAHVSVRAVLDALDCVLQTVR